MLAVRSKTMPNRRRRRRSKVSRRPKNGERRSSVVKVEQTAPAKETKLPLIHLWQGFLKRGFLPTKRKETSPELAVVVGPAPVPSLPLSPGDESERLLQHLFNEYYTELLAGEEEKALGTYIQLEDATRVSPLSPAHIDEIRSRVRRAIIQDTRSAS